MLEIIRFAGIEDAFSLGSSYRQASSNVANWLNQSMNGMKNEIFGNRIGHIGC